MVVCDERSGLAGIGSWLMSFVAKRATAGSKCGKSGIYNLKLAYPDPHDNVASTYELPETAFVSVAELRIPFPGIISRRQLIRLVPCVD